MGCVPSCVLGNRGPLAESPWPVLSCECSRLRFPDRLAHGAASCLCSRPQQCAGRPHRGHHKATVGFPAPSAALRSGLLHSAAPDGCRGPLVTDRWRFWGQWRLPCVSWAGRGSALSLSRNQGDPCSHGPFVGLRRVLEETHFWRMRSRSSLLPKVPGRRPPFAWRTSGPAAEGTGAAVSSLPQVPYETLNKRFRAAQKNIDRETSHVTMVVAELEKTLSGWPAVDSVVSLLDGVVEKLSVLKRKVSALPGCAACPAPSHGHLRAPPSPPAPGGAVAEGGPHPVLLCCRRQPS